MALESSTFSQQNLLLDRGWPQLIFTLNNNPYLGDCPKGGASVLKYNPTHYYSITEPRQNTSFTTEKPEIAIRRFKIMLLKVRISFG